MTEQEKPAADAAAAAEAEAKAKADADAKAAEEAAAKAKETIGDVLDPKDKKPEGKTVPEAAFLDLKNANKELKRDLAALQRSIEEGASAEDVSADIDAIGEEFGVDKKFLKKLATAIRKDADKDAEEKLAGRLKPLEAKERQDKIDKVFGTHFDKAMAEMPEFASVVNRDVIKSLSLDPANQNKTFAQLIEDTYGKAVPGKRTLETTTARGGKSNDPIDYTRAVKDPAYFSEIMSNPDTKKEYNAGLTERLSSSL